MPTLRSYAELERLGSFDLRYDYLRLSGQVGRDTFGFDRWINQRFYRSTEWRNAREFVLVRDNGCDLGIEGHEIYDDAHVHHMNPMALEDIQNGRDYILDPNFLISVSLMTHNAIHYGTADSLRRIPEPRQAGDTKLW